MRVHSIIIGGDWRGPCWRPARESETKRRNPWFFPACSASGLFWTFSFPFPPPPLPCAEVTPYYVGRVGSIRMATRWEPIGRKKKQWRCRQQIAAACCSAVLQEAPADFSPRILRLLYMFCCQPLQQRPVPCVQNTKRKSAKGGEREHGQDRCANSVAVAP